MENEALDTVGVQQGIFSKSENFNGKPSWKSSTYQAIWYNNFDQWLIGTIDVIGSNTGLLFAESGTEDPTDNSNEWNYWDGSNWILKYFSSFAAVKIGKNKPESFQSSKASQIFQYFDK